MATKKETEKFVVDTQHTKRLNEELENLEEAIRSQEDKLDKLYDLEASLKVMALAVGAITSAFSESNEELFRRLRTLKVIASGGQAPETDY
jgi:hypothetical protein